MDSGAVRRKGATPAPRVTRHSRDLAIQLRKADVALKKAQTAAAGLDHAGTNQARIVRHSRDLAVQIARADEALRKAKKLMPRTPRHSRDLAIRKKVTRLSKDQ